MVTVRVKDWTKKKLDEIRDRESHSSIDSVIKTLLKDREYAQSVRDGGMVDSSSVITDAPETSAKPFEDLTVLAELDNLSSGVVFLWCPNCAKEIVHIGFEDTVSMSVFEIECQHCLSWLDEDAVVAIEVTYPIENRLVNGVVEDEIKECVIDYWDRSLASAMGGRHDSRDRDVESLLDKYAAYCETFEWTWPVDVPVVRLQTGETYRNVATEEKIEVVDSHSGTPSGRDSYQIRRHTEADSSCETDILEGDDVMNLLVSRDLVHHHSKLDETELNESIK